ncbi:glycosyltransferase family 4 protein [Aeromicrobium sp.]|uniref:glycosyltransferase family 4 protein n=1 Tax=Aeromicrobium sp. TaxID=1871063 RepID=UPI002FCBF0E5
MSDRSDPAHVVMLVGNDIAVDTRVKKTAASLARLGLRVTVVGYGPEGLETARMAGCDIIRVPIPWTHHKHGRQPVPRPLTPRQAAIAKVKARRAAVIEWGTRPTPARPVRAARKAAKIVALQWLRLPGFMAARTRSNTLPPSLAGPDESEPSLPWRLTVPIGLDYLEALTPQIVALSPDVIHAHDVHTIGAASSAADQLEAAGARRPVWLYDAHEFIAGLSLYGRRDATERAGWLNLEQEFAPRADAVVTVSPVLAQELASRYPAVPRVKVVLNAPWESGEPPAGGTTGLRAAVGIGAEAPLLVYSGVVTHARGVDTAVEAMPALPGCHLAIVSTTFAAPISDVLRDRADELGVADRVHILPPVPAHTVVDHLASADVGLIPIRRFPSHDVALTNKLFEYIHAGLPVVVSDCTAQKQFVHEEDIGAVHVTEDSADLALAVQTVLGDLEHYRARARRRELRQRYSWQASEQALHDLYAELLGPARVDAPPTGRSFPDLGETDVEPHDGTAVQGTTIR